PVGAMARAKQRQHLHHQIVAARAQPFAERAIESETVGIRQFGGYRIAAVDEGEQRLDRMIAIRAPRPDMQREVDLGPAGLAKRRHGAVVAGVSPSRSFASSRVAISASASKAAARQL